ncbi:MAG: hypothetical protein U0939_03380 [Pirellulales bacterium]
MNNDAPAVVPKTLDRLGKVVFAMIALLTITAVFAPIQNNTPSAHAAIGYLLGTIYAQITVASAWLALGEGRFANRAAVVLAWLAVLPFVVSLNLMAMGRRFETGFVVLFSIFVFSQALLTLAPLALLRVVYGWHLVNAETHVPDDGRRLQFGLKHLMLLTTTVAILFGAGRAFVLYVLPGMQRSMVHEAGPFAFLAVAAVLFMLPLLFAAFAPGRWCIPASLAMLALAATATYLEEPLAQQMGIRGGPDLWHFIWINAFSALSVLAFSGATRYCGYRLFTGK